MNWQVIIPMSGFGERFRRAGHTVPKPLIEVLGKPIIGHVLDMFPGEKQVFFICNQEHLDEPAFAMREILTRLCPDGTVIGIPPHKRGPVYAISRAFEAFDPAAPTIVNYCDFTCIWNWERFKVFARQSGCAGAVMCYTGFHPHMLGSTNYAYVRNDGDRALFIQEKKPFTDNPMGEYASSGTYYFSSGAVMRNAFEQTLAREDLLVNSEHYVSLAYVPLLEQGLDIRVFEIEKFMQWGTPEDLEEFLYHAAIHTSDFKTTARPRHPGTLLLPMAGLGSRFAHEGYTLTKPLIPVDGRPMFQRARADLPETEKTVYVVRRDMPGIDDVVEAVEAQAGAAVMRLPGPTDGQAVTCLKAMEGIDLGKPLTIGACDNGYLYDVDAFNGLMSDPEVDFIVWVQRRYPPAARKPEMYGWAEADQFRNLLSVRVKKAMTCPRHDPVVTGAFTFKEAGYFVESAMRMMGRNGRVNGEFYIDECCNDALALGLRGRIFEVGSYICWGTPSELRTFEYWRDVFRIWQQK